MGRLKNAYNILFRNPKGREYSVDLDISGVKTEIEVGEVECQDMDWILLIWDSISDGLL
jgi:hypothetical protein